MASRKPADEVRRLLAQWIGNAFTAELPAVRLDVGGRVETADSWYQPAPIADARAIVQKFTPAMSYQVADRYDCEDVALSARVAVAYDYLVARPRNGLVIPPAFGFLLTVDHATNFGLDENWRPYLYDVRADRSSVVFDGSFLEALPRGWLGSVRRIRYVFI